MDLDLHSYQCESLMNFETEMQLTASSLIKEFGAKCRVLGMSGKNQTTKGVTVSASKRLMDNASVSQSKKVVYLDAKLLNTQPIPGDTVEFDLIKYGIEEVIEINPSGNKIIAFIVFVGT